MIDADQNAWLIHRASGATGPGKIAKYLGSNGAALGVFDVGANPYTYSDATGIQRFSSQPQGTWTVIQDATLPNNAWRVKWNNLPLPTGTTLGFEARTAATVGGLPSQTFTSIPNGGASCVSGRVLELRAKLTSLNPGVTPTLTDATVYGRCDLNGDGLVSLSDISAITAARGTPAANSCDARDADGSGLIDVNDARQCAARCSKPNCAN